jgi:hypothetical protein
MRFLLESSHRAVKVWLVSAIVVLSLLTTGVILTVSVPSVVACTAATQRSDTTMPPCTRRVTIKSEPCGAMIYINDMELGQTPMSFPMPTGRYTLVLLAPGHERFRQRILVPENGPLEIDAKLVPKK